LQKCASARLWANACFTEESPIVGVVAGYRRVQAAKEIGWNYIEGNVVSVSDSDALFLALKTNMMREDMSEVEQGKVLHEIAEKCDISNVELAKKLGKSEFWVRSRIKLALNLHENVAKALEASTIGFKVAEIISGLDPRSQNDFLLYISENNIKDESEVLKAKNASKTTQSTQ
jgi:ParB family chromosome partitioning protein